MKSLSGILFCFIALFICNTTNAQLIIREETSAQALVEKLVGTGVSVFNIRLTAAPKATGFFNNISGTNIGLDSGIVLSNGRVRHGEAATERGMDGDGITMAYTGVPAGDSSSTGAFASTDLRMPGDADLESILSGSTTNDATILEFDFVPTGDTIRFRYVFSSEEYPTYPCANVNDAFAFFIRGPGFPGLTNIALVPGTADPVTIDNINYKPVCGKYPQFYIPNQKNTAFTHNGHTTILEAIAKVRPCQRYHLKLVIADVSDGIYDSGVFLEAKSLSSNSVSLSNTSQTDQQNNSYLVEGCATGTFKLKRPKPESTPLTVTLTYEGTAINGTDVQLLPPSITIPANQTEVVVNILPIIDNLPEGMEELKIYAFTPGGCGPNIPTDSTIIQLRDYDTLGISPDTALICKNAPIQLVATTGYTTYAWDADPSLTNTGIRDPFANPTKDSTTYYCTSTIGTCHGRDSAFITYKDLHFSSKKEINCKDDATGEIRVSAGPEWAAPVEYSINNDPYQASSTFRNLPVGLHTVRVRDAEGCIDSLIIAVTQLYPDLVITNAVVASASCLGTADGKATITVTGGNNPYLFSVDGTNFQSSNILNLTQGNYTVTVKDNNSCITTRDIVMPLDNTVTLDAGADATICEGKSTQLKAVSNGESFLWTPAATLNDGTIVNPVASPVQTTKYILVATTGICTRKDSATVFVNPAPKANAGSDQNICYGQDATLTGSGGVTYLWSPTSYLDDHRTAVTVARKLTGSINYFLNVMDINGCVSLQKDTIRVNVARPALLNAGNDTIAAIGQPLQLSGIDVNSIGFVQYTWSPGYGLDNPFAPNPVAILDRDIIYTVTASNAIGCEDTDEIRIKVYRGPDIYVPNAFSPNADGLNDILKATPVGIKDFHFFRIYNRWGNIVFSTGDYLNGWDGKLKSSEQPAGTYVWVAEGIDYKGNTIQRKGTVTIIK